MTTKQIASVQEERNQAIENLLVSTRVSRYTANAWNRSMAIPSTEKKLVIIGMMKRL